MWINPQIFRKTTALYYEKERKSYFRGSIQDMLARAEGEGNIMEKEKSF